MSRQKRNHTVAIIPARGGSKGIPKKNLRELGGLPLIAYSILAAKNAGNIDRVVVSTEDIAIADTAREWGAEVPFLRSRELAGDQSLIGPVIKETLERLYGTTSHAITHVVLYPTSPLRSAGLIHHLTQKLHDGYGAVTTAKPIPERTTGYFHQNGDAMQQFGAINGETPAQWFRPYGVFSGRRQIYQSRSYVHRLDNPVSLIDIDYEEDLALAESVIKQGLFNMDWLHSWQDWNGQV